MCLLCHLTLHWLILKELYHFRTLSSGQRGEVYEVSDEQVAVVFDISSKGTEEVKDTRSAEVTAKPSVCWLHGIYRLLNTLLENLEEESAPVLLLLLCSFC